MALSMADSRAHFDSPVQPFHGRIFGMDEGKRIATELFARFSASDIDGVLALMTDDVTWRIPGKTELNSAAGTYAKERLERLFRRMFSQLEDGLKMTVLGVIAEGNQVAVEVESSGDLRNGRRYRQQYHFAITLRDGKIAAVREYLDTQHAFDVWLRPEPAPLATGG
jgi:ketosteroid isomerase-like protein